MSENFNLTDAGINQSYASRFSRMAQSALFLSILSIFSAGLAVYTTISQDRSDTQQIAALETQTAHLNNQFESQQSDLIIQKERLQVQHQQFDVQQKQFAIQQLELAAQQGLLDAQEAHTPVPAVATSELAKAEDAPASPSPTEVPPTPPFVYATQTAEAFTVLQATRAALQEEQRQLIATQTALAQNVSPQRFISNTGIPSGGTYLVNVNSGEMHVWTGGPLCVLGECLAGGFNRGSVVIMRSIQGTYDVELTNLVPENNWHGGFRASSQYWSTLVEETIQGMKKAPSCTAGKGCEFVDVIVIESGQIVEQFER